jgi:hypothetical protein
VTVSTIARAVAARRQPYEAFSLPPRDMFVGMTSRIALFAGLIASLGLIAGCSMPKIWPFYKKPLPVPEVVHEVDLVNADGSAATYPQYWKRNTLVIDLSGVSGTGSVAARLPADTTWPVRVAVRVQPGSVEQVEVLGEERNVLAVSREGTTPIELEFAGSVYRPTTGAIYISWGYMPQFAEVVVEPEAAEFVSPTEVPQSAPAAEPPAESNNPGATEIITPSEVTPQPSPPPGS